MIFLWPLGVASEKTLPEGDSRFITPETAEEALQSLREAHGALLPARAARGVERVAALWWESDGTAEDFKAFCLANYLTEDARAANLPVILENLQVLFGYQSLIRSRLTAFSSYTDRDELQADSFFREAIPQADPWKSKLGHFIQLNFPYAGQEEKFEKGPEWSRAEWAVARLGDYFHSRPPAEFRVPYREEAADFSRHISTYFLRMGDLHVDGQASPFPEGFLLNCHHGLRDNIKEDYTREQGLERQRLSGIVIERILQGQVPEAFLEDEQTIWDPVNQTLYMEENGALQPVPWSPEGLRRFEGFNWSVKNRQYEDNLFQDGSTALERNFFQSQLTLEAVESLIREFLGSAEFAEVGRLVSARLGRELEAFDIWYSGFQAQSKYPADQLDSIVRSRYPNPRALQNDLPEIFRRLGFSEDEADWLGNSIEVRPVVSGGYSNRPPLPGYMASFTTAFPLDGLDYKGFRIAMHELGHVTEMLYSMREADYPVLVGVPTAGITEGAAEFFAYRNIRALGLDEGSPEEMAHMQALATFWYNVDMGGQALTEMEVWKWMTDHPDATPGEVKEALLGISRAVWNDYFAPVFGVRDQHILGIYNHMITGSFYLYNYFIGNVVMFQLFEHFARHPVGYGFANACREGNTLPDLWMKRAVGEPLSILPLLQGANKAVTYFTTN